MITGLRSLCGMIISPITEAYWRKYQYFQDDSQAHCTFIWSNFPQHYELLIRQSFLNDLFHKSRSAEDIHEKCPAVKKAALNYSVQFNCWTSSCFSVSFSRVDEAALNLIPGEKKRQCKKWWCNNSKRKPRKKVKSLKLYNLNI